MSVSSEIPTFADIMRSPEFTGAEVMDQMAFQIRTVIKSGKHGKVALCESADDDSEITEVAIKSELIKSPQNPYSRPYREYLILKQLGSLLTRSEFYANPCWVGYIQILDWFKAKTDQVRVTSTPSSPVKTPTKVVGPLSATKPARGCLSTGMKKTAHRSVTMTPKISYGDENDDVGAISNSVSALGLTPSKRNVRATPKRIVPRTPLLQATEHRHREIKLQEGNLVLEKADTTLSAVRTELSFEVWRDVLFQILYALYVGQSQFEFMHRDLHLQNVLLKRLKLPRDQLAHLSAAQLNSDSGYSYNDAQEALVDQHCGIFQDGTTQWYSRGPWIVKLSDFGLSRITLVGGDGTVIYDLAQPLAEAFLADGDVLQVVDEFSKVKITRWLSYAECVAMGVHMADIKEACFTGPEKAISTDEILSTMQSEDVVAKVNEAVAAKQKAVKGVRSAIRKSALHLRTLLHHDFFAPLRTKPDSLWLFDSPLTAHSRAQGTPSSALNTPLPSLAASMSSTSPDSPPLPVKKLSFDDPLEHAPLEPTTNETDCQPEISEPSPSVHETAPIPPSHATLVPKTPSKSDSSSFETTPMRRSARVAARSVEKPKPALKLPVVKPDPVVMSHAAQRQHLEHNSPSSTHKRHSATPTPSKSSTRKSRRDTILPSELASILPEAIGSVNKSLASLFIEPAISAALEDMTSHLRASPIRSSPLRYDPVPSRCLGSPIVLPMLNHEPVNCIEALKDYLMRRAQKLEESRPMRRTILHGFFIRTEIQLSEARVLKLAKKAKARPVRRASLGSRRKSTVSQGGAPAPKSATRPKRKSMGATVEITQDSKVEETRSSEQKASIVKTGPMDDSSAYNSDSEPTAAIKHAKAHILDDDETFKPAVVMPRRSARRASISAPPLSAAVPSFVPPTSSSKPSSSVSKQSHSTVHAQSRPKISRPPTPIKAPSNAPKRK